MTTPRDDIAGLSERLRAKAEKAGREWSYYPLVTEAAAQLVALSARLENLVVDRDTLAAWAKKEEARAIRAEQERDKAIKLIRPLTILAEDTARVSSKHGSEFASEMSSLAARARSFVRRLAPGPEKEKKE